MLTRLHDALHLRTTPPVFFGAAVVIILFVVATIVFTEPLANATGAASEWLMVNMGWFYILGVTVFLIFLIYMAASRFGRVRLGPDGERPEHSNASWFAMLFAAGIGSILMFWGVAEPVSHFGDPPRGESLGIEAGTYAAAKDALNFAMYHFTFHTWAIFTLPSLAFAYFIHKRNLPPRVSSIFQPILGRRIHGPIGTFIDIVAIIGTIFGVAVSIGLGTLQINGGLEQLIGIEQSAGWQLVIIGVVTLIAMISVGLGLEKGIKTLSNINIAAAVGLLIFVLVAAGGALYALKGTIESFGSYLANLPDLAFWNDTLAGTDWQNTWTVFYWAWTITWSPFVGIFIARISRGRTIREFVIGVLAVPSMFSVIWFGIFGYASLDVEMRGDGGLVERVVEDEDIPGALFELLSNYPAAAVVSFIAILIVVIFFITSLDSAALVVDTMANGHEDFNPLGQRLFWALAVGLITATLLVFSGEGGLTALENISILIGLPFFVIAYFQMYALRRALREDAGELPLMRTREWRQVLPPHELIRRIRRDGDDRYDYGDPGEAVAKPQPTTDVPVMRDPYVDDRDREPADRRPRRSVTLAGRTGSRRLPRPEEFDASGPEVPPEAGESAGDGTADEGRDSAPRQQ